MLIDGLEFYGSCNATYYGKVRISEHLGISHLTGKKPKIENSKVIAI